MVPHGCAPGGRRCAPARSASAGIGGLHVGAGRDVGVRASSRRSTTALPSTWMPVSSAMPPRSTSCSGAARPQLHRRQQASGRRPAAWRRRWPRSAAASASEAGRSIGECVHGVFLPCSAARLALALDRPRQTLLGVAGMSRSLTPRGASASSTALITAGGEPIAPASPQPLTPSGLCVHGVHDGVDLEAAASRRRAASRSPCS